LTELDCDFNKLTKLLKLPNTLTYLFCFNNILTELPELPDTLTKLHCSRNQLTELPELPNTLTKLHCFSNQLTELPKLPDTLTDLNCSDNQLKELPKLPDTLTDLECFNNPQLLNIYPFYDLDDIRIIQKFKNIYYQIKIYKSIINFIKRYKFKKIQEELIIKTWHPKRFFDWCLSIDDKLHTPEEFY
jgi:Leucine-rich repeat (LRR) protein